MREGKFFLLNYLKKKWGGLKPPQPLPLRGPCLMGLHFERCIAQFRIFHVALISLLFLASRAS